jgi:hypothetical protein
MFIAREILPNGVAFVKIVKTNGTKEPELKQFTGSKLEITGFDSLNEALFNFTNGDITQSFGITLKQYKAK